MLYSVHSVELGVMLDALGTETWSICEGDSAFIFGEWVSTEGSYESTFSGVNGCDSVHVVDVVLLPLPEIMFTTAPSCSDENTGYFGITDEQGALPFQYNWVHTNDNISELNDLSSDPYLLTITVAQGCSNSWDIDIGEVVPPIFELFSADID